MMHYRGYGYGNYYSNYEGYGYGYSYGHSPYGHRSIVVNHNDCVGGCPNRAFCDYGICRCREGYEARFGRCYENFGNVYNSRRDEFNRRVGPGFDHEKPCQANRECGIIDMNMICSLQKTCACRPDMKWNSETGECQIFMDVDCSDIDVNSEPATAVSDSSVTTMKPETDGDAEFVEVLEDKNITDLTANDTLKDSGLVKLDINKTTEVELKTEFCREVSQIAGRFERQTRYEVVSRRPVSGAGGQGTQVGAIVALIILVLIPICCCCAYKIKDKISGGSQRGGGSSSSSVKGGNDNGNQTGHNPYQMPMQQAQPMQPPPAPMMEEAPAAPGPAVPPPDAGSNLPVYGQPAAPLPYSVNPAAAAPAPAAA